MIADPRTWPDAAAAPEHAARLHAQAATSLGAAVAQEADRFDAAIVVALRALIEAHRGAALAEIFDTAPSAPVYRHLWRLLARAERPIETSAMAFSVFALPLVIVAGLEETGRAAVQASGTLPDAAAVADLLREHGALRGNRTFAFADALAGAPALDVAELPALLARRVLPEPDDRCLRFDLPPAPFELVAGEPHVHLRFLVGTALAAPHVDLFCDRSVGKWGVPATRELSRQLAPPGATILVLPQPPQPLVTALAQGRARQREVSAQLFAGSAIRKLRAEVGEPSAIVSAHAAPDASRGGELRVSLSSAFDRRAAEGFRCPLYPVDHADDVAQMLVTLLRDCRITDVRVLPGVHGDRDPVTGLPLLFKADGLAATMH